MTKGISWDDNKDGLERHKDRLWWHKDDFIGHTIGLDDKRIDWVTQRWVEKLGLG